MTQKRPTSHSWSSAFRAPDLGEGGRPVVDPITAAEGALADLLLPTAPTESTGEGAAGTRVAFDIDALRREARESERLAEERRWGDMERQGGR